MPAPAGASAALASAEATWGAVDVLVNSAHPGWVQSDMGGPTAPRTLAQGAASWRDYIGEARLDAQGAIAHQTFGSQAYVTSASGSAYTATLARPYAGPKPM